jgi:hypothetical protein
LLVWLTAYFPISVENGELSYESYSLPFGMTRPHVPPEMTPAYQAAIDALNEARISVYPAFAPDAHNYDIHRLAKDTLDGLSEVARRTGGTMLGVSDEIDIFSTIAGLRKHFDSYYMLTFTLQGARKNSWIDSTIKVNKEGMRATAQAGFFGER